jgi:hypothetical protein
LEKLDVIAMLKHPFIDPPPSLVLAAAHLTDLNRRFRRS